MPYTDQAKVRASYKRWYDRNQGVQAQRVAEQKAKKRAYIQSLKRKGQCVDCEEDDWRTLDFDHVSGIKEFNISDVASEGVGWDRLHAELAKCELRCSNCHRKRTIAL